ncbi:hypothetical protein M9H77_20488 [Catharanthus roseus]|uniref:Uncharacterized protein n=1 Tax=Catharanthus roseus TaxID=4058 RepID=A0ACC0AJW4_CATRO|nr:hypothetical protein M9H77_20488 [Catharanthus roseus]
MRLICRLHSQSPPKFPRAATQFSFEFAHLVHSLASDLPNSTSLPNLLQGNIPYSHLLQIHGRSYRLNAHHDNLIATRLIGHYPPKLALRVFYHLHRPNIFPFNAIIRVLSERNLSSDAFFIFKRLRYESLLPNDLTFSFLLKACCGASDINYVKQIHTHVVKSGFSDNSFVSNGLLNVYAKGFRDLVSAHKVFDDMLEKNMVCCWTSLISGYAQLVKSEEVLRLFLLMVKEHLRPENDTMVSVLSACSNLDLAATEKWVQKLTDLVTVTDSSKLTCDFVNTVLIYLFGKWGKVDKSRERFDEISDNGKRSVVPWNAMITAYIQNGCALEGLNLFRLMIKEHGYSNPNHITMVSVLSACAQIGDLELGIWAHEYMKNKGRMDLLKSNRNLATALIDMYSKCGHLDKAIEVFDQLVQRDVVSFNAMIMGLAINGKGKEAFQLFSKMQELGLRPNANTFLSILCSCSHSGLLEEGRKMFRCMMHQFSVSPGMEHYACYIDLLARAGCIEEALAVVSEAPFEPNEFIWGALLGGCLLHNRLELSRTIAKMLVKVEPHNSAGYVLWSNALAVDHHWGDVSGLRWSMRKSGVSKQSGCSWISVNGVVHEFVAGSAAHPQHETICHALEGLLKEMKLAGSVGIS